MEQSTKQTLTPGCSQYRQDHQHDGSYRANVGVMLIDDDQKILAGEACYYPGEWLMPQGGIQQNESPRQALWRELLEETGISKDQAKIINSHPEWLRYQLRKPLVEKDHIFTGQTQKWFLLKYNGPIPDASRIEDQEFLQFDKVSPDWLLSRAAKFKTHVYEEVFNYFL